MMHGLTVHHFTEFGNIIVKKITGGVSKFMINVKELYMIQSELVDSRTDSLGKTHATLSDRLSHEHLTNHPFYLAHTINGNDVINNTMSGGIIIDRILGNTVGGYDGATPAPIVSSGMEENGVVKVKSCGANLLNPAMFIAGSFNNAGGDTSHNSDIYIRYQAYINAKEGDKFRFIRTVNSETRDASLIFYDFEKNQIASIYEGGMSITIICPEGTSHIRLRCQSSDSDIQLQVGEIATNYEPYQESVLELELPESMKPSGFNGLKFVKDELREGINGFAEIEQLLLKNKITGNENWIFVSKTGLIMRFEVDLNLNPNIKNSMYNAISNKIIYSGALPDFSQNSFFIHGSTGNLNVLLNETGLISPDLAGFKAKLREWHDGGNGLEVIAELKTPIIHQTTIPNSQLQLTTFYEMLSLKSYNDITNITLDNIVAPSIHARIPTDPASVISKLVYDNKSLSKTISSYDTTISKMMEFMLKYDIGDDSNV